MTNEMRLWFIILAAFSLFGGLLPGAKHNPISLARTNAFCFAFALLCALAAIAPWEKA